MLLNRFEMGILMYFLKHEPNLKVSQLLNNLLNRTEPYFYLKTLLFMIQ